MPDAYAAYAKKADMVEAILEAFDGEAYEIARRIVATDFNALADKSDVTGTLMIPTAGGTLAWLVI
ncbi:MAG TPA: hypothetical protein VNA25_29635 [Phycisphaerae bacterium]|nr:hypothetical protein [Phycisphaerae bacterium]